MNKIQDYIIYIGEEDEKVNLRYGKIYPVLRRDGHTVLLKLDRWSWWVKSIDVIVLPEKKEKKRLF